MRGHADIPGVREAVYAAVRQIPKGKVVSYGDVARAVGIRSARMIGRLLHQNSSGSRTPCHRVVFKDGSLAPGYVFGGPDAQRRKLEAEGVLFCGNRVDMARARHADSPRK